jgi:hypothetical protein
MNLTGGKEVGALQVEHEEVTWLPRNKGQARAITPKIKKKQKTIAFKSRLAVT